MDLGREKLQLVSSPLVGFARDKVYPVGTIGLPITAGNHPCHTTMMILFLVVNCPSTYITIIGRKTLNKMKAVTSTYHMKIKFLMEHGVGEVNGDQVLAKRCYLASLKDLQEKTTLIVGEAETEERTDSTTSRTNGEVDQHTHR